MAEDSEEEIRTLTDEEANKVVKVLGKQLLRHEHPGTCPNCHQYLEVDDSEIDDGSYYAKRYCSDCNLRLEEVFGHHYTYCEAYTGDGWDELCPELIGSPWRTTSAQEMVRFIFKGLDMQGTAYDFLSPDAKKMLAGLVSQAFPEEDLPRISLEDDQVGVRTLAKEILNGL